MKPHIIARAGVLLFSLYISTSFAADRYVVRTASRPFESIWDLTGRHGGSVKKSLRNLGDDNVYLVDLPSSALQAFKEERDVESVEPEQPVTLPLRNFHPNSFPNGTPTLPQLADPARKIMFFGSLAWGPYLNQPAASIIRTDEARRYATGAGVVAVIDTGVDPTHPVLAPALTFGWDFTRDVWGGSEQADIDQEVTPILDQEVTPILDRGGVVILNQDSLRLNQEVTPILDNRVPAALGHGTMTAGIVHLVAPTTKIMPLKAFRSDGTGLLSDVIAAIYWAADHGANVISMSFDASASSPELAKAVRYANSKGIVLVASAGNDGQNVMVYPAGYDSVIGVASTSDQDVRSSFSNYGQVVTLAAPGEAIVTTYPRNRYALGWGTSFSAPMVSGAAALLLQIDRSISPGEALDALSEAVDINSKGLGEGRLDLVKACIAASRQKSY